MKEDNQIFAVIGIIIAVALLYQYGQGFIIAGYGYQKNLDFLGYNATVYSTIPFEGLSYSMLKTCGSDVTQIDSISISSTSNSLGLSTYSNSGSTGCGHWGQLYSGSAITQINDLNINSDYFSKLILIYSQSSSINCGGQDSGSIGPSSITLGDLTLFTSGSATKGHPISNGGEITLTKLSNGQYQLSNNNGNSLQEVSDFNDIRLSVSAGASESCSFLSSSSSSSLLISSISVEYFVYHIMGDKCVKSSKNYNSLTSTDYNTLQECEEKIIPLLCNQGDLKCDGLNSSTCMNNSWIDEGKVEGKCGYTGKYDLEQNQLVAMESFSGGSTISKTSTRYPVVSFIYILPPIVIDAIDNSVVTGGTIYNNLDEGKTLQIPTSQVWSLFYVIDNNYQLPTICDIIDVETGQCAQINPGVVIACSEGQFDPSLGLCVVQPESRIICPEGGRYDVSQAVCIFNPPLQAVCPEGSIYNVNTEQCEHTPDTAYICDDGFDYDANTGKCEKYPSQQINCPGGYAYDETTDKCIRYPDERIICPIGATYNLNTDKCEYTPPEAYVCQTGFTYNPSTGKCELKPAEQIICGIGNYNENLDLCIYEPQVSNVCSNGILTEISSGNYACIYTPETIEKCPTGTDYNHLTDKCEYHPTTAYVCEDEFNYNPSTGMCEVEVQVVCIQGNYDSEKKACVYEPNMEYLCINGELIYENEKAKCVIYLEESIICPRGFTYNEESEECVIYPDYWTAGVDEEKVDEPDEETFFEKNKVIILIILLIGGLILFNRKK